MTCYTRGHGNSFPIAALILLVPIFLIAESLAATATDDGIWVDRPPPPSSPPDILSGQSIILDPVRKEMIVFGGAVSESTGTVTINETWALSLEGSPIWTQILATGTPPSTRVDHSAIYDASRERMIVFGGRQFADPLDVHLNDVWALSLSGTPSWTELFPTGTPPLPNQGHRAIFDPVGDQMVVFGGNGDILWSNESWVLSLSGTPQWNQLAPTGTLPIGRSHHGVIYDPLRQRMVLFGGVGIPLPPNKTWALSLSGPSSWTELAPGGTPPSRRWSFATGYDLTRDRMLIFGGAIPTDVNETWALSFDDSLEWNQLMPTGTLPPPVDQPRAVFNPDRDRLHLAGDWELIFGNTVNAQSSPRSQIRFVPFVPNPSLSGGHLEFELPAATWVRAFIYGPSGRLVHSLVNESFPAGKHRVRWDGSGDNGAPLPPGVYFYDFSIGQENFRGRVVLLR